MSLCALQRGAPCDWETGFCVFLLFLPNLISTGHVWARQVGSVPLDGCQMSVFIVNTNNVALNIPLLSLLLLVGAFQRFVGNVFSEEARHGFGRVLHHHKLSS